MDGTPIYEQLGWHERNAEKLKARIAELEAALKEIREGKKPEDDGKANVTIERMAAIANDAIRTLKEKSDE